MELLMELSLKLLTLDAPKYEDTITLTQLPPPPNNKLYSVISWHNYAVSNSCVPSLLRVYQLHRKLTSGIERSWATCDW